MKKTWQISDHNISIAILCAYFIPLVVSFLLFSVFSEYGRWILAISTLCAAVGATFLILSIRATPRQIREKKEELIPEISEDKRELLSENETLKTETERLHTQIASQQEEMSRTQQELHEIYQQMQEHRRICQEEHAKQIAEQQAVIQNLQQECASLAQKISENLQLNQENKEKYEASHKILQRDLENARFELETLLKLEVTEKIAPSSAVVQSKKERQDKEKSSVFGVDETLTHLLRKAQELSETRQKTKKSEQLEIPQFLDLSLETLAIEKRRLIDVLEAERGVPAFIINCQDGKILFVSEAIKTATGIPLDRFQKEFFQLVGDAKEHIKNALTLLKPNEKTKIAVQLQSKVSGKIVGTQSVVLALGVCPLPPFSRNAIGVVESLTDSK